jgi:hypothetical protein
MRRIIIVTLSAALLMATAWAVRGGGAHQPGGGTLTGESLRAPRRPHGRHVVDYQR